MLGRKKILLVDDDEDYITVNRTILEKNGYEVVTAYNAGECREKVRSTNPDLIVLDVMMESDNDGFDLACELHRSEETGHIPIVMVTAVNKMLKYPWQYEETHDTILPVDVLIEKPVEPERLLMEINRRLEDY